MSGGANIVEQYAGADVPARIELLIKYYPNFIRLVEGYEQSLSFIIKEEKAYARKSAMEDLGVRVQTSGTSDPTAKEAIENIMIMEAIQKGNLESLTSELDEQVVMKYQREVVTVQNMREDYQILRNQFFYLEPADVDSFEKYLQCGRHTEKLAYELDIKPEALKMQMRPAADNTARRLYFSNRDDILRIKRSIPISKKSERKVLVNTTTTISQK